MVLPNFLLIGASKAATSSVRGMLLQHPDVFLANQSSEVQFFARDELFAKGLEWYESFFEASGDRKAIGECSNVYTMKEVFPHSAPRIIATLPEGKLIYSVRDPMSRISSYWMELRSQGDAVHFDFARAVRESRDWLVDSSNYGRQLASYRAHFPPERIHIVFFEDFRADPAGEMRRCLRFLDVDPDYPFDWGKSHLNPSEGKRGARPWVSRLRRVPGYRMLKELLPARFRRRIKSDVMLMPLARPEWDAETRRWVLDQLRDDCRQFLADCGKPRDFWELD